MTVKQIQWLNTRVDNGTKLSFQYKQAFKPPGKSLVPANALRFLLCRLFTVAYLSLGSRRSKTLRNGHMELQDGRSYRMILTTLRKKLETVNSITFLLNNSKCKLITCKYSALSVFYIIFILFYSVDDLANAILTSSNLLMYRTSLETRNSRNRLNNLASLRMRRARDALMRVCWAEDEEAIK